jgi:hypothetical protein
VCYFCSLDQGVVEKRSPAQFAYFIVNGRYARKPDEVIRRITYQQNNKRSAVKRTRKGLLPDSITYPEMALARPNAPALDSSGAGDGIRTRDIFLGKEALYH